MESLEGQCTDSDIFEKLVKPDIGLSSDVIVTIASGLYRFIQLALRFSESSLKPEVYIYIYMCVCVCVLCVKTNKPICIHL